MSDLSARARAIVEYRNEHGGTLMEAKAILEREGTLPPLESAVPDVDPIAQLQRERDEARALVAEANNSLYGSQGYFHSLDGGPFDRYHLARGIEALKGEIKKLHYASDTA